MNLVVYRLFRLNASTPQRLNASTPQRLNASTPQRLNASTQQRSKKKPAENQPALLILYLNSFFFTEFQFS
jgi:hypothetical protein